MRMNRRNVLVGLGTIVAGGGAALGTGAFSSVEADRGARFTLEGDQNALLLLTGDGQYVTNTNGNNGESIINFEFTNLNDDATSIFEGVLTITNNAQDNKNKDVYISDSGTVSESGVIDFEVSDSSEVGTPGNSIVGSTNSVTLDGTDDTVDSVTCDIVIDTGVGDPSTVKTITVVGKDNS